MLPFKTTYEVLTNVSCNLSASWLAVIFVAPNFIRYQAGGWLKVLTTNLGFGIVGIGLAIYFSERAKKYDR